MINDNIILAEFGDSYVKLAIADTGIGAVKLHSFERFNAPVYDGEITDTVLMKEIIDSFCGGLSLGLFKKRPGGRVKRGVRIVVQHPNAIIRVKRYPKMKDADLRKAILNGFNEPLPINDIPYAMDYRLSGSPIGNEDGVNAVIVGIPEAVSVGYSDFFVGAGYRPLSMDTCANAASVYIERVCHDNAAAVFENKNSVNILLFENGRLIASRDIRYETRENVIAEAKKYLLLYYKVLKSAFIFTDLKIAGSFFGGMNIKVYNVYEQFLTFRGMYKAEASARKDESRENG